MNPETPEPASAPLDPAAVPPCARRRYIPNLLGWSFAALAVLVLVGLALPVFAPISARATQTKSLASAKQIALALKLYAGDHDGKFPTGIGDPSDETTTGKGTATTSNAAFANVFPMYCTAEKLFYTPGSAYCNAAAPDEIYNSRDTCLAPGENNYAYIAGLADTDDATLPLVVDGTDGRGHYVSDRKKRGGVWGGRKAIIIHVDDSGEVRTLAGPANATFIPRSPADPTHNLLDPAYLNTLHARLLEPAVAGGH